MFNPLDMTGSTIMVTGASSGIGKDCALLLSKLGARVILVARNVERLEETKSLLWGDGHKIEAVDLASVDAIAEWMREVALTHGRLNGLVHSAGVRKTIPIRFLKSNDIRDVMDINLNAAVHLVKGFRQKDVKEYPASIVLVSSVMGLVGQPGVSIYSASKAALIGLVKSLALELAPEKIRINCVAPGYIRSEMFERQIENLSSDQIATIESHHPLGLGDPMDIACAIAFLLSNAGKWITGSTLVVDGGYTAH